MPNLAAFLIEDSPSTDRGYIAEHGDVLALKLDGTPSSLVQNTTFQILSASDTTLPRATKNAPLVVLDNGVGGTGSSVRAATPAAEVSCPMPSAEAYPKAVSYIVRCLVNGGVNKDNLPDPDYVSERIVSILSASGFRKVIGSEGTQFSAAGWADAQNDMVDELEDAVEVVGQTVFNHTASGTAAPYTWLSVDRDRHLLIAGSESPTTTALVTESPIGGGQWGAAGKRWNFRLRIEGVIEGAVPRRFTATISGSRTGGGSVVIEANTFAIDTGGSMESAPILSLSATGVGVFLSCTSSDDVFLVSRVTAQFIQKTL